MPPPELPRAEVAAAAASFRLQLRSRHGGGFGARRGSSAGGATDFVDFRGYALGDDLRHIDWRGFARSDQLRVRLFEDEVAPSGEVLLDRSPSLAVTAAKWRAARDLAQLFAALLHGEGGRVRVLALGGDELLQVESAACDGPAALLPPRVRLRPRSVRIVVSDFLVADDPAPLLRQLADGAARLVVVQLLDAWELRPTAGPSLLLEDSETAGECEVAFDARAIAAYEARLQRLQARLREVAHGLGGGFASVVADTPEAMCRNGLLPAGIVEPSP